MEYFGMFFGIAAFCMVCTLQNKVRRLERILRDNGLWPDMKDLGGQLRRQVGQTVELTLESTDWDLVGEKCRVLDADETWALVRANEGKKNECEKLIRLDSVKQIKVK